MIQVQHLNPVINIGGSALRKGVRGETGKREKGNGQNEEDAAPSALIHQYGS